MLVPRKVKHRKWQQGTLKGGATAGTEVSFGKYGIISLNTCWVTSRQIESARRAMTRYIKRGGKIWIRIFPDKPVTAKGEQSTMGSGKGAVDHYVAVVKAGQVLFEMDGVTETVAREAMRLAGHKLPLRIKFVTR